MTDLSYFKSTAPHEWDSVHQVRQTPHKTDKSTKRGLKSVYNQYHTDLERLVRQPLEEHLE
ncbi:hypothetical protein EC973_008103, partial [Apophysomyces ossiformis]